MSKGRIVPAQQSKPKLLWIADAVAITGFANVTHSILDNIQKDWDINILGVNYYGDPHQHPYPIYPASLGGDVYGIGRLEGMISGLNPDLVCVLNDPWIAKEYIPIIKKFEHVKSVLYTPVDSPNMRRDFIEPLNSFDLVIAYNDFGLNEMKKSGLVTETSVIGHGTDTKVFTPLGTAKARAVMNVPEDWYIVGLVNRNQPRKRIDLALYYFSEWVKDKPDNIKLYYHGALRDQGIDIVQLCNYFGIEDRLIITSPNITPASGVPKGTLNIIYNSFNVHISTTKGEGFGLTNAESMAAGVPNIVPNWSALGEWCRFEDGTPAVHYVPCTNIDVNTGGINTVGGIADKDHFIEALNILYNNEEYRKELGERGRKLLLQPRFDWKNVAASFNRSFQALVRK